MASNYPTVYYGSYGETVKQLQQALNALEDAMKSAKTTDDDGAYSADYEQKR